MMRFLSDTEVEYVSSKLKGIYNMTQLDEHMWTVVCKSFAKTDADFKTFKSASCCRDLLFEKDIFGGAIRQPDGIYFILLKDASRLDLVRHEIQHIIDDADNHNLYAPTTQNIIYLEQRAVQVQLQSIRVSKQVIHDIYCT